MLREKWIRYGREQSEKSIEYLKFYNALKTDSTRSTYVYNMRRFMDYLVEKQEVKDCKDYKELVKWDDEKITDVLEFWVIELNKERKATAISTMLAGPELFFDMNRKIWHKKLVKRTIKKDLDERGGKLPASDEDVSSMLKVSKHVRDRAVIHFLASTGSRPAGISDPILRMKHLVKMPHGCYSIKIYDESTEGYWAFLTPEASRELDRYFSWRKNIRKEDFTEDTPIFANFSSNAKNRHLSEMSLRKIVERSIRNAGIERTKYDQYNKSKCYNFIQA